jgi:hypothetical protein
MSLFTPAISASGFFAFPYATVLRRPHKYPYFKQLREFCLSLHSSWLLLLILYFSFVPCVHDKYTTFYTGLRACWGSIRLLYNQSSFPNLPLSTSRLTRKIDLRSRQDWFRIEGGVSGLSGDCAVWNFSSARCDRLCFSCPKLVSDTFSLFPVLRGGFLFDCIPLADILVWHCYVVVIQ